MPPFARTACFLLILFAARTGGTPAAAQEPRSLSDEARISLITILPGDDIYALWGHSALRVVDPVLDMDRSYNYGTFSFDESWFVPKFMYGALQYRLDVHNFQAALRHYRLVERRPVIEQQLNLSREQQERLFRFLQMNYRPENRNYRYNFLFDNCSTRIRDALAESLGQDLHFADEPDPGKTFRELLDPYQSRPPLLDAGIDWLLGAPVDRVALPYETMFLPDYLKASFDHAEIDVGGERRPLVARTDTLFWIEGRAERGGGWPWAVIAGWLLLGAGVVLSVRRAGTRSAVIRALDGPLFLVVGTAGILITFLWFVSLHDATEDNWHLLWAWPTHIVVGVCLLRKKEPPLWLRRYVLAAATLAGVAVAGIPIWPEAFHPALIAVALLVAVRGGWIFAAGRKKHADAALAHSASE